MIFLTLWAAASLALASASTVAPVAAPAPVTSPSLAATPLFRHYNIDQGLPSSDVYTVAQDRHGMIWLGTITGLASFDGTHFTVYRHIPGDAASLSSDDVSSVLADSQGRLWAGGEGSGVNLFEPATGGFRHFKHHKGVADSLSGNDVLAMAEGRGGTLWVGTYGHGLDHMTSPGHFAHLEHDPKNPHSLASDNVLSLLARADGTLWIGTDKGLDVRRPDGRLTHVGFKGLSRSPAVWNLESSGGQVFVATTDGLFVVGADGVAVPVLPGILPAIATVCSVHDQHGNLWVGTVRGLYLARNGQVTHFPARPLLPGGQPGQIIFDMLVDRQGGLWLATKNAGLAYLSPDWHDFAHFAHRPGDAGSLSASHAEALLPDGHGKLWVTGGMNQLDLLDPATGAVTHDGKLLGSGSIIVHSMAAAGGGGLWLGSGRELVLLDDGKLQRVKGAAMHGIRRMLDNGAGTLYVAPLGRGMYQVDRKTLAVTPIKPAFASALDLQTSSLLMHDGQLWRASHAGLSWLPTGSTQLVPVVGVARGEVWAMAIAGHDLWLVRPDGLEHYRLDGHHATLLRRVDAAAGWPGIVAYTMLVDRLGRVWLFGNAGLWRYNPASGHFRHFGQADGLPNPDFTTRQLVHVDNTVFAGTLSGVVGFHPAGVVDRPRMPQLEISSIRVRRGKHTVELSPQAHHLHLHWNDRDLRITALALSYIAPKRNHYRFYLKGLDTGWVDTGTRGVRELAGLESGQYVLKVEAAGPSGVWAHLSAPLTIDVDAPPWLRPWAWALYVLIALLLGFVAFTLWRRRVEQRHRVQLAEQKRQLAEQASAAKTRFLADLGHEIRTPMTGVLGMAELLSNAVTDATQRGYAQAIHDSGELLLKLVNDALDLARIEAGRLELASAPLDPRAVLNDVRQLLQGQALAKGLSLTAETDPAVPAWVLGDVLRLKQILLNLAGNAIKFTRHGSVRLRAAWIDGELVLHVIDTGPGISNADRERLFQRFEQADSPERDSGSGLGLAICRELVALMHGHITLTSAVGEGSHFEVHLPLPEAAADAIGTAPPVTTAVTPRHILLVEDDATVARVIQGLLETRGHRVTHAEHSLQALGALADHHFDLLLLDLDLPGMDGYRLAEMIRQRETDGHTPIAAITARSGGDEEQQARAAGMDAFARKPLTGDQLAALIERLCQAPANPASA